MEIGRKLRNLPRKVYSLLKRFFSEEERLEAMVGCPLVWQESRTFQFEFLRRTGLQPHHSLLDLGCGPLRGGIPLIEYLDPGNYVGLDIRPKVVEEAQRQVTRAALAGKKPLIIVSTDFGKNELGDRRFDYVWGFQLLYHLEDKLADDCCAQMSRRLKPTSNFYANVNTLLEPGSWKEFPFLRRSVDFYEALAERHGLSVEVVGRLDDMGYSVVPAAQHNLMLRFQRKRG